MPKAAARSKKAAKPAAPSAAAKSVKKGDHVFLVDGSSYIYRAFHALPPLTRKSDGLPVGAVYGFCNMLWKLLVDAAAGVKPTHFAVIFDKSEITFRNELYKDYKAHRPEAPDDLKPQFGLIRKATAAFSLPAIEQAGFEADDLIATYARQAAAAGADVTIVVLRQGPDAARRRWRHHVRHHEGPAHRRRRGHGEVRRRAGQGHRRAVACRRLRSTTCRACPASASRRRRS